MFLSSAKILDKLFVWNVLDVCCRRLGKGVETLVEASAAEAEAISATLAAAKARQINGEVEQPPDRDRGAEASPSGNQISSLIKVQDSALSNNVASAGVRLHHRAVSINMPTYLIFFFLVLGVYPTDMVLVLWNFTLLFINLSRWL